MTFRDACIYIIRYDQIQLSDHPLAIKSALISIWSIEEGTLIYYGGAVACAINF